MSWDQDQRSASAWWLLLPCVVLLSLEHWLEGQTSRAQHAFLDVSGSYRAIHAAQETESSFLPAMILAGCCVGLVARYILTKRKGTWKV